MPQSVDRAVITSMLTGVARRLREETDSLSKLDAATGDGDHGMAMRKVADAIDAALAASDQANVGALLSAVGWAIADTDSGSTGPLYGSFFMGMGTQAAGAKGLGVCAMARVIEAGVANLRGMTKAQPGDKTLVDAILPAAEAIVAAAESGAPLADALEAGALAAAQGAAATRSMQGKFGRARHIGVRAVGHLDPGAVSMACVFAGLREGLSHVDA